MSQTELVVRLLTDIESLQHVLNVNFSTSIETAARYIASMAADHSRGPFLSSIVVLYPDTPKEAACLGT